MRDGYAAGTVPLLEMVIDPGFENRVPLTTVALSTRCVTEPLLTLNALGLPL